jgi:hypothetical protein
MASIVWKLQLSTDEDSEISDDGIFHGHMTYDFNIHFVDLDFVVIGNPQSGTSSLNRYLPQHPEIFMSPGEESFDHLILKEHCRHLSAATCRSTLRYS